MKVTIRTENKYIVLKRIPGEPVYNPIVGELFKPQEYGMTAWEFVKILSLGYITKASQEQQEGESAKISATTGVFNGTPFTRRQFEDQFNPKSDNGGKK